jgi:hypothetical protein
MDDRQVTYWGRDDGASTERGGMLVVALFMTVFAIGVVVSGTMTIASNKSRIETSFLLTGQASEFARSGMTEAMNWFRRQPTQPVGSFAPQLDASADPPVLDTEDPTIGLVREFRITGNIFGRYEVWKRWDADPDVDRKAWRRQLQVEDVSAERGSGTPGTTWKIRCRGLVYERRDESKSFREYPNRVIATETLVSEMSRMAFALPGQAAICASQGSNIDIRTNARIDGGPVGVGAYYPAGTGSPTIATDGKVDGVQPLAPTLFYDDSTSYVFGVTDERLNAMADLYLTKAVDFPARVRSGTMIVLDSASAVRFTKARPLRGYGIVVVRGDVVIEPGSSSFFFGVLFVDGSLTVNAPCLIRGAVVAKGKITALGVGDFVDIVYDDRIIQDIQLTLANYRTSRAPRRRIRRE